MRSWVLLSLVLLALVVVASGQRRRAARGPRALAVVEIPESGKPLLVPVTILIEGRYYDAAV